jgi:hypothetical protein
MKSSVFSKNKLNREDINIVNYAIISLKPKPKIKEMFAAISSKRLDMDEKVTKDLFKSDFLDTHTVVTCIPLFETPKELELFIKSNSEILLDMMLTSFPFPIHEWDFQNKDIHTLHDYAEITYYPIVYNAIKKPAEDTNQLSVTLLQPSHKLIDYWVEKIGTHEVKLATKDLSVLELYLASGIAIIGNIFEKNEHQDSFTYAESLLNPAEHLRAYFGIGATKTLLELFFINNDHMPHEIAINDIHKWFIANTSLGLFMLIDPSISNKYAKLA